MVTTVVTTVSYVVTTIFEGRIKATVRPVKGRNSTKRLIGLPAHAPIEDGYYYIKIFPDGDVVTTVVTTPTSEISKLVDFFMMCLDQKGWGQDFSDFSETSGVQVGIIQKYLKEVTGV